MQSNVGIVEGAMVWRGKLDPSGPPVNLRAGADSPFGNSGTARGPGVSRGPHEMPLVPFS
ncbi:unnamed protein product [Staurois parvus]|uniref:Uncharacterized protein n=1 Tax=Staurois parvus TaxID=386267 RepID=A0ABN9H1S7_9NEOB|nr:unnamed protein product [Staurois parvus]